MTRLFKGSMFVYSLRVNIYNLCHFHDEECDIFQIYISIFLNDLLSKGLILLRIRP